MTSKEALKEWYETMSVNDKIRWEDNYLSIKKDLELLDIIKFLIKKGDIAVNPDLFVDYPELYEWLEQNE